MVARKAQLFCLIGLLAIAAAAATLAAADANGVGLAGLLEPSDNDELVVVRAAATAADRAAVASQQQTLLKRLGASARDYVASIKKPIELVARYYNWARKYNALLAEQPDKLQGRSALQALRLEYAAVDNALVDAECALAQANNNNNRAKEDREDELTANSQEFDSSEHVLKVLPEVIDRLERKLARIDSKTTSAPDVSSVELDVDAADNQALNDSGAAMSIDEVADEQQVRAAMDRVKRTAIKLAKNAAKNEGMSIARMVAVSAISNLVVSHEASGDLLGQLAPVARLLGASATPVAMQYLNGIKWRATWSLVGALNPVPHVCKAIGLGKRRRRRKRQTDFIVY